MQQEEYDVVCAFESKLAQYCGSAYCVVVNSCTNAIMLSVRLSLINQWQAMNSLPDLVCEIPRLTYIGVPMAIMNAGAHVSFRSDDWQGSYEIRICDAASEHSRITKIIDSAMLLTSNMQESGTYTCLSFDYTSHLKIGSGGAILVDSYDDSRILKKLRFHGMEEGQDARSEIINMIGFHFMMHPRDAADGLARMKSLSFDNKPLARPEYQDLSKNKLFGG